MQKRKFGNNDGRKQRKTAATMQIQDGDTTTTTQKESGITVDCTKKPWQKETTTALQEETAGQHFFKKTTREISQDNEKDNEIKDLRE